MNVPRIQRVVFDTNTVVSALVFTTGRLAWLRSHWSEGRCLPLISAATAAELKRVLAYPKLKVAEQDRLELLSDYLPYCVVVDAAGFCPVRCRDPKDQPLLDLAHCGQADILVTGDHDLLILAEKTAFSIESPDAYRQRIAPE